MKMKMDLGNGVSLIGSQEDITSISILLMNGDLQVDALPQKPEETVKANPVKEDDWYEHVLHFSHSKGRNVVIGDMDTTWVANVILAKMREVRRGQDLCIALEDSVEFRALLLALVNRLDE